MKRHALRSPPIDGAAVHQRWEHSHLKCEQLVAGGCRGWHHRPTTSWALDTTSEVLTNGREGKDLSVGLMDSTPIPKAQGTGTRCLMVSGIFMHAIELRNSWKDAWFACIAWCWGPAICMFFMHCSTKKAMTWSWHGGTVAFRAHD